jgi:hypothetical protein
MLLSSSFDPKPLWQSDHQPPLHPLPLAQYLHGWLKWRRNPKTCYTMPCRPPLAPISLATPSSFLHVLEHLWYIRITPVPLNRSPLHGPAQNARVQNAPGRASRRGDHALDAQGRRPLARHRPRPASLAPHRAPPLHPLRARRTPVPALHRRRRPRRNDAARPVMDIARARAIPSPFCRASYSLSISRTRPTRSRPLLALSLAGNATPWPRPCSTPRHPRRYK